MTGASRWHTEIAGICDAVGVAAKLEQVARLAQYLDLLGRWNATYNLTAVRDPTDMLTQHLSDCLAVLPAVLRHGAPRRVLDAGSGGGLPGVVLAIFLPQAEVSCVDAVGKKTAFVRQVAGTLSLDNLHALHLRIEGLKADPFDLVTSRAFASLSDFTALTSRQLAPGGVWMAMKGRAPDDEIAALPSAVDVFHVEQLQVPGLDAQRCLVWMRPRVDTTEI